MTQLKHDRSVDEMTKAAEPQALSRIEQFVGCSWREAQHQRRLAREIKRQVKAQARSAQAANLASMHPLPFE